MILPLALQPILVAIAQTSVSTCLCNQTAHRLLLAQQNYLAPTLQRGTLFAGRSTAMRCTVLPRTTVFSLGLAKSMNTFLYFLFLIPFNIARKVKSSQHLVTCVRLSTTRGTPGQCSRKVTSSFLPNDCLQPPMSKKWSLR